ncbi:MAG: T9SS type A sorting domain-containing protein [Candidatus Marinimicrobia bacterium]|nr:T9SS type A sorting domain-containing protein [Candidatus Neomarinimicrobiota bacterium]MBL7011003.1 T9SS type A sorting domain-containing protein [Candidatus Neomarinimicrobiota bacterium]MBL7031327.1 T9SS type A sorting domain-containing protein [Candidatus Neomarinimicrobiota bacterium]
MKNVLILIATVTLIVGQDKDRSKPVFSKISENELSSTERQRLNRVKGKTITYNYNLVSVSNPRNLVTSKILSLNLYDNLFIEATRKMVEPWGENNYSWIGIPNEGKVQGEYVILELTDNGITGYIFYKGKKMNITPLGEARHVIYTLDPSENGLEHPLEYSTGSLKKRHSAKESSSPENLEKTITNPTSRRVDVLVAYTTAAKNGASPNIASIINGAKTFANQIYNNSKDSNLSYYPQIDIVHQVEVSYTEQTMAINLSRLVNSSDTYMDNLHTLRTQYGADIVILFTNTGNCGLAYDIQVSSSGAFAVVKVDCEYTQRYSFTHEIGHLFGSKHELVLDSYPCENFCYGHGFTASNNSFQTVMAVKAWGSINRILYLSNPDKSYNGTTIGSSADEDNMRVHDVRVITIANFYHRPLSVEISGITDMFKYESETLEADFEGGNETASTSYQWYKRLPPTTSWTTLGTGQTQNITMYVNDIEVKVVATNSGDQATDTHYINYAGGGWFPKSRTNKPPTNYSLKQNYPNPFNPSTSITFDIPKAGFVQLIIFDITGRKIKTLINNNIELGQHSLVWDGKNKEDKYVPAGIYFYRLITEDFEKTNKMVVLK